MDSQVVRMKYNHLCNILKRRRIGLVKVPTLPGHGPTLSLNEFTAENWMMEAEQALRLLQKASGRVVDCRFFNGWIDCPLFIYAL